MKHITVIGCGLIGGSFAALVKKHHNNISILGIGRRKEPLKNAVKIGIIDEYSLEIIPEKVAQSDYVILATPISTILPLIKQLTDTIKTPLTIIDFSSVKSFLDDQIITNSHHNIVALHPMGGREVQGIEHAASDILEDCPMITFDSNKESPINTFFKSCSFKLVYCKSYQDHDKWMTKVSHGPYLIANLIPILLSNHKNDDLIKLSAVSAGGFRDTTRVSSSPIEWGMDIIEGNRAPLLNFLTDIEAVIRKLKHDLENDRYNELRQTLELAKKTRQTIINDQ
ncbi:MAG: prephenate dehydrogenase [Candidatus Margulisiibacteriota bacterium]|nr:prephenate dehydrogenase [Candidatus Margulisiibacteriota bacterium]